MIHALATLPTGEDKFSKQLFYNTKVKWSNLKQQVVEQYSFKRRFCAFGN